MSTFLRSVGCIILTAVCAFVAAVAWQFGCDLYASRLREHPSVSNLLGRNAEE